MYAQFTLLILILIILAQNMHFFNKKICQNFGRIVFSHSINGVNAFKAFSEIKMQYPNASSANSLFGL